MTLVILRYLQVKEKHSDFAKWACTRSTPDGSLCMSTFTERNKLRDHIETTHEGIRKFRCAYKLRGSGKICGQAFKQKCDWKRHLHNVHFQKRYRCVVCSKSATRDSSLKKSSCNNGKDHTLEIVWGNPQ